MSSKRKSWREKLADDKGFPKVFPIDDKVSKRWGTGTFVIPAPLEVDGLMRQVKKGRVTTLDEIRRALASIWTAIERLQEFPDMGMRTDADIRQIVVRFGASGYIVRYAAVRGDGDILITRIWHGREART